MSHSSDSILRDRRGISLLEILLALAIIAIVVIYFTRIMRFAETGNKADEGRDRMEQVVAQFKAYYRSHQALPDPNADPGNSVPLGSQQLELSQRHRLDPWGNYLRYFRAQKQDAHSGATITNIVGFEVNGRKSAGVLISLGPDQVQGYTVDDATNPTRFTSGGDDYLLPITLEDDAWEIVMAELEFLDKRVAAYDRFFAGVNNNPNNMDPNYIPPNYIYVQTVPDLPPPCPPYADPDPESYILMDEGGCVAASGGQPLFAGANCLRGGGDTLTNDPNCGRATIDSCLSDLQALSDLTLWYVYEGSATNVTGVTEPYRTDPWGNPYAWGGMRNLGAGAQNDPRYHLFFSMGPNGVVDFLTDPDSFDDILPY